VEKSLSALAGGVLAAVIGCAAAPPERGDGAAAAASAAALALSNADVTWEGNAAGFVPYFVGAAAARAADVRRAWPATLPDLLDALSDPERFVVAHVLLTQIGGVTYPLFPTWNGLVLDLRGNGKTIIDPGQRFTLEKRWQRWAHEIPHPKVLPPAE
jgi:hypothetical protein